MAFVMRMCAPVRGCACRKCDIELPPNRLHEGHLAVRFGDSGKGYVVTFNGQDISRDCSEAMAGEPGWAIVYGHDYLSEGHANYHLCRGGHESTCEVKIEGTVRVSRHDISELSDLESEV